MTRLLPLLLSVPLLLSARRVVAIAAHTEDYVRHGAAAARDDEVVLILVTDDSKRAASPAPAASEVISLGYPDGGMQSVPDAELRARFSTLLGGLKPDRLMTCDPWARYDSDFDHEKVGRAAAAVSAGMERWFWSADGLRVSKPGGDAYADWYTAQVRSGRAWAAPKGPAALARPAPGKGKTLVIVQPHADDFSGFAGGAVLQFIEAGYTAYIVNVTNDEKDYHGLGLSTGETIGRNARELGDVARMAGIKEVINLNLKNDELESFPHTELRGRLMLAFRTLKPDVMFAYDPWSLYERNPDHARTARAAAEAAWAAGNPRFNPEHLLLGLKPHAVRERYYFPRGPSDINRYFDISAQIDRKIRLVQGHKTMMQSTVNKLRDQLAIAGLRMPQMEKDGDAFYLRMSDIFERERSGNLGKQYGVAFAEHFHYEKE